jgi:putative heme-binding domain-containing protein
VGPNLSNYGRKKLPPDSLMTQILDPNRLVAANYMSYIVVLDDGRVESGLITDQTPTSVTIKRDKDVRVTILRKQIDAIKSSGKSLMPEGLEKKVNQQEMADLLEFLMSVNQRI